jgi:hypothetical protein
MKKILLAIAILGIVLGMSDCKTGNEDQETGPFSLIGTWEAEGESANSSGKKITYKCTLIFSEAEYAETTHYKSEDASVDFTARIEGSYTKEEDVITGTGREVFDDGNKTAIFEFNKPYKFINKNSLKFSGLHPSTYTQNSTFKRQL